MGDLRRKRWGSGECGCTGVSATDDEDAAVVVRMAGDVEIDERS